MVTPLFSFSLFLGSCFFGMPSFLFLGNHNLTLFYFRNVLWERLPKHGALLMGNGWMMVLIPNVGMSQMDGLCTYLWSRKHVKHLTRVTQFDKTQQNIKQHMCKVFHGMEHMALVGLAYHWGTCLFNFFWKQIQISSITRTNLHNLIYHIWTHNNLDSG